MAVPFVDSLTTNLDHSLPLTVGEFDEFGNAKENIEHFKYIKSYSPYHNIKKMDYPHILITTSLSDNRVFSMSLLNLQQNLEIRKQIIIYYFLNVKWMRVMVVNLEEMLL